MDFHKYDNIKLNLKDDLNNKIKALFLLFDRDTERNKLTYLGYVKLLNYYINTLIQHEEFEAVIAFKERKKRHLTKYKRDRRDYYPDLMWRFIRRKLYRLVTGKLQLFSN